MYEYFRYCLTGVQRDEVFIIVSHNKDCPNLRRISKTSRECSRRLKVVCTNVRVAYLRNYLNGAHQTSVHAKLYNHITV